MPTPIVIKNPEPRLFHVNLEKNGKVYLLLYKGNKVHVLYDENKNITNLKFRTELTDVEYVKKDVDRRLSEHRLEAGVLKDISDIISIVGGPFDDNDNNNNNNNNSTKRIKLEREEIEETSLKDIPRDILRQIGADLDVYELFALMLTSKFLYNSLKKVVLSKIYINFEGIFINYMNSNNVDNYTHVILGRGAKIALEDIQKIYVPQKSGKNFIFFFKKYDHNLSNLTNLNFELIDEKVLEVLPDSLRVLNFSFEKSELNTKLPNRLEYLGMIKKNNFNMANFNNNNNDRENLNTFTIHTDILPMSIKVIKVAIKKENGVNVANYRLKFFGTFNHPLLTEINFNGIVLTLDLPPKIRSLQVHNMLKNAIQLPNTLVELRLTSFSADRDSIYNLVNLKTFDITHLRADNMKFLPRGLEELYITNIIEPNRYVSFSNEGMPQGLKILDMFEDINSDVDEEGPVLRVVENFPSSMITLTCRQLKIDQGNTLGSILNEGMKYIYVRRPPPLYGKLPSTLVYMNLLIHINRFSKEPYIEFPKSLKSMTVHAIGMRGIPYELPESLEELYLDFDGSEFKGLSSNLVNLKKLKVDIYDEIIYENIKLPSNIEDLTINTELRRVSEKLPESIKKFSHGRYGGIRNDPQNDKYVGDIFVDGYNKRYFPEGIEELTVNEDDFYFGNCQLTEFKKLRQLEVDVRDRTDPNHEGNLYSPPDNLSHLNLYLIEAKKMVHFKLPMNLVRLYIDLNSEEVKSGTQRSRNFIMMCYYENRKKVYPKNILYTLFDKIHEGKNIMVFVPKKEFSELYKGETVTWFQ